MKRILLTIITVGLVLAESQAQLYTPELKVKDTGGNVGIGTDDPGSYTLNVNGSFLTKELETISGNFSLKTGKYLDRWQDCIGDAFTLEANPNYGSSVFRINSGHSKTDKIGLFNVTQQNQNIMYIRMDGNVGIGTSIPETRLHVDGDISISKGKKLVLGDQATGGFGEYIQNVNIGIGFYTNNLQRAFVANNGFIGIGTSNPEYRLHVSDRIKLDGPDAGMWIESGNTDWFLGSDGGNLRFYNATNRVSLTPDGRVGIGTSAPSATFQVERGTGPSGTAVFGGSERYSHFNYSTSEHTYIRGGLRNSYVLINDNGGNVGIGTSSPNATLDVNGKASMRTIEVNGTASMHTIYLGVNNGNYKNLWTFYAPNDNRRSIFLAPWNTSTNSYDWSKQILFESSGNVTFSQTVRINQTLEGNRINANQYYHRGSLKWADFVFASDYQLPSLPSVEEYIKHHNHLPDIPSEAEVKKNGINLGEMDAKLLQKIEELTLYLIDQNKKIEQLQAEIEALKK